MDMLEKSVERINEIGENDTSLMIIKGMESALYVQNLINKVSVNYGSNTSIKNVIFDIMDAVRDKNHYGFFENELKVFCFIDKKSSITDIIFNNYKSGEINLDGLKHSLKKFVSHK